jgi:diguanylate cyclase (GGDEF)-like protein
MDTVSRIGGDEFIIILRDLKAIANAEKIAVAVLEKLSTAFIYKENQLFIGGSIGISIFPEHGIDADTLINKADLAMYDVKLMGGNGYKIYLRRSQNRHKGDD